MYDVPHADELQFMIGAEVQQLCIGRYHFAINCSDSISIGVSSAFRYQDGSQALDGDAESPESAARLHILLGEKLKDVVTDNTSRTAELVFHGSKRLRLIADSDAYECFTISSPSGLIVV